MPAIRTKQKCTASPSPPSDEEAGQDEAGAGEGGNGGRADFNAKVYDMVRQIPEGKVASYGQIAKLIGHPRHSRLVGTALKVLPRSLSSPFILPPPPPADPAPTDNDEAGPVASISASASAPSPALPVASSSNHPDPADPADEDDEDDGPPLPAPLPNPDVVPWWRVVSQTGAISPRGSTSAVERQADYLRAEGVEVREGPRGGGAGVRNGEGGEAGVDSFGLAGAVAGGRVSMAKYAWKG
ncbi:hypothetical protein JCM8547_001942 [Rhodosporidiobolus lusitaniae]